MYRTEQRILEGRRCTFFVPEGSGPFPAVCLCVGDVEGLAPVFFSDFRPPALYYQVEADWGKDLTPWPAPALPGREPFAGGGPEYLRILRDVVRPALTAEYPIYQDAAYHAIAGYSLGGLFALWTLMTTDLFGVAASLSGSLWYDGWLNFLEKHVPPRNAHVYLSLGRSEEHAGNLRMAEVGDATRGTYACLVRVLGEKQVTLAWNRGGHFTGIPNRWGKAMDWMAAVLHEKRL